MYSIQVDETLQKIVKIFYRLGIWQGDDESNSRKIVKKLFYTFIGALFPIFFATNAKLCVDQNESIFSIEIAIVATILFLKLLYLLYKKQEILAFLYDQNILHSIQNREEYEQASKKIKKFMRFVRPYCIGFFITGPSIIAIELPIFSDKKGLPFFISFSWNDSEIVYWSAYLFLSVTIMLFCVVNLITILIWYIMLSYSIEYKLLGNKLRNFGVEKKRVKTIAKNQKNCRFTQQSVYAEDIIVLIKAHRNLNDVIERFRSCFSKLFMGQISTSGIIICTSVYNLAFGSQQNILHTEMYGFILFYGFFDIFLVMYLANDITVASDRLSYCLFESNWIERTESCKKYVVIMGEVLKQPQQLVVLIYPMNLETFMTIINGAYSMFNILKNFK